MTGMLLLVAAAFVGALLQRISGIGFAMVVAPFTIIAIGPVQGVVLVQICGVSSALLVLTQVLHQVDWRAYLILLPPSAIGVALGALAAANLPNAPAQVLSAVVMLVALGASVVIGKFRKVPRNWGALATAGSAAGIMTVVAGVGGVALTALQQATRWEHRSFAATLQPYLITLSTWTVFARLWTADNAWPDLSLAVWASIAIAMVLGIYLGGHLTRLISSRAAARLTVALSLLGAITALIDGLAKI